jgi:hypothetical protein
LFQSRKGKKEISGGGNASCGIMIGGKKNREEKISGGVSTGLVSSSITHHTCPSLSLTLSLSLSVDFSSSLSS